MLYQLSELKSVPVHKHIQVTYALHASLSQWKMPPHPGLSGVTGFNTAALRRDYRLRTVTSYRFPH